MWSAVKVIGEWLERLTGRRQILRVVSKEKFKFEAWGIRKKYPYTERKAEGKAFQLQGPGCARVTTWGSLGTTRRQMWWLCILTGFGEQPLQAGCQDYHSYFKYNKDEARERWCLSQGHTYSEEGLRPQDSASRHNISSLPLRKLHAHWTPPLISLTTVFGAHEDFQKHLKNTSNRNHINF